MASSLKRLTFGLSRFSIVEKFHSYHGFDWILAVTLSLVILLLENSPPFYRQFSLNDMTISHPFAHEERVPNVLCLEIAEGAPFIVIILLSLVLGEKGERARLLHVSLLGLFVSFSVNGFLTDTLKNWIGRPRPDFLERCIPAEGTPIDKLVTVDVCTQKNLALLADGFRSTPSGHSSTSFQGLFYLTLWLCGQLLAFTKGVEYYRLFIAALPTLGAMLIAISRTEDYRHHFVDVILGSTLGSLVAWITYRKYFPSIFAGRSYVPHPSPTYYHDDLEYGTEDPERGDYELARDLEESVATPETREGSEV